MTPLEGAQFWTQQAFHVVPVPYRTKKPELKQWPQLRLKEADLPQYFNGTKQNIGIILGDENGSADVDLDCNEAILAGAVLLPGTHMIFGRLSRPQSHYIYHLDPPTALVKYLDPIEPDEDKATIAELRCTKKDGGCGFHTVVPPSVHESGEAIQFEPGFTGPAANVEAATLSKAVARVAAASLLARYWPKPKAGRNDAFLAVAGILARAAWTIEEAIEFNFAIYRVLWQGHADQQACVSEVRPTFEKYMAGAEVTGIPKLKTLVDPRAVDAALPWLGADDMSFRDEPAFTGKTAITGKTADPAVRKVIESKGLTMSELRVAQPIKSGALIENFLATPGAMEFIASHKTGKTVLSAGIAFAVATGHPCLDNYRILKPGHVIVIEQDDPAGVASWQDYLLSAPYEVKDAVTLHTKNRDFVLAACV